MTYSYLYPVRICAHQNIHASGISYSAFDSLLLSSIIRMCGCFQDLAANMGDRIAVVDNRVGASTAGRDGLLGLLSGMVGPAPNTAVCYLSIPNNFAVSPAPDMLSQRAARVLVMHVIANFEVIESHGAQQQPAGHISVLS